MYKKVQMQWMCFPFIQKVSQENISVQKKQIVCGLKRIQRLLDSALDRFSKRKLIPILACSRLSSHSWHLTDKIL